MGHDVTLFRTFPFTVGQKIRIEGSRRAGDWEIVGVGENEVTLKCPISKREFTWPIFCYVTEEKKNATWPLED